MENLRATAQKNTVVKIERRTLGSFLPVLPRLRMKPSRLLLVLVALLAGGAAAFLATQHDQVAAPAVVQTATQPAPVPKTEVLVAKAAIGVGQRLTPDAVEWKDWPQDAVSPEYITVAATPDAVAGMAGSMARSEFIAGEPIRREKLARADQGYLASVLDSGMRGVSVSVTAESASGGFIAPNDRVDVLVTRSVDGLSETVLQNTRVLAINDRLSGMDGAATAPAAASIPAVPGGPAAAAPADATNARVFSDTAIATLELDPDQAQVVIAAASTGKLSLALRSVGDIASTATDREAAANEAIRLTSPFWTAGGGAALQTVH
jgi:pilus assembly protein CpaB